MEEKMQETAETLKVLADPARLLILRELSRTQKEKNISVCDLARHLGISQPNVSHHLRVLKSAGFISCQKDQRFCYYSVNLDHIGEVLKQVMADISS